MQYYKIFRFGDPMICARDKYLDRLVSRKHNGLIKVITGVRRCGKSYLLFELFYDHLRGSGVDEGHILRMALDSFENRAYCDVEKLHKWILDNIRDDDIHYILLDEIQLANGFEMLMNSLLRMHNVDVYVTGPNSRYLSSDIITEFRGRTDEVRIRPLSFSEYVKAYDGDRYEALDEYLTYGGLPELLHFRTDEQKATYLDQILNATYLLDIKERKDVRLPYVLDNIMDVLSSSIGSLVNVTNIKNTMISTGYKGADEDTITKYIGYLEDAYLFEICKRYDIKGRKHISSTRKYYPVDHGLTNARLNFRQMSDRPQIMETIIYNELRSRGFEVDVGEIACRKNDGEKMALVHHEVDFIARMGSRSIYIQSVFRMDDPDKKEQKLRPLMRIRDSFKKVIILGDSMKPHYNDDGILFIGLIQFLMDENSLNF